MALHGATRTRSAWLSVFLLVAVQAAGAPSWRLPDLNGEPIGPGDFAGDWVVVNYWATWCKPCREEMPELDALNGAGGGPVVLGVAWEDASVADLRRFLDNVSVGYPVVRVDPFDPPGSVAAPRVLPTTVVYGPEGAEVERFHGPVSRADIERVIQGDGGGS